MSAHGDNPTNAPSLLVLGPDSERGGCFGEDDAKCLALRVRRAAGYIILQCAARAYSAENNLHRIEGRGDPIVFVHGNASTHETWADVIRELTPDFSCISYDLPGHGGSALPPGPLRIEDFVDDLESLRAELNLERAHFVGHSLGAFVVANYMRRYPARIRAGCLMAAPAGRDPAAVQSAQRLLQNLKTVGVREAMGSMVRLWYTDAFVACHPEALDRRLAQIVSLDEDAFIRTYELYADTEIAPWLADIEAPVLVTTGEFATGAGAKVAEFIAGKLPRSELVVFEGMKNGVLTEIPGTIATELRKFFGAFGREP